MKQQAKLASETASTNTMTEASANLRAAAQVLDLFVDQPIADETPFVETGDAETISVVLRTADESADTGLVLTPPAHRSHNLSADYRRRYY